MTKLMRRIAGLAGAGALGVGLAAGIGAPALAATVVTPVYGMTCNTGYDASGGYATCYSPNVAKWKVRLDCSWGGTYDSIGVYTDASDGWYRLNVGQTCLFGVNSVSVIELR